MYIYSSERTLYYSDAREWKQKNKNKNKNKIVLIDSRGRSVINTRSPAVQYIRLITVIKCRENKICVGLATIAVFANNVNDDLCRNSRMSEVRSRFFSETFPNYNNPL